jgi:membrane associated rhomboid family serine protease
MSTASVGFHCPECARSGRQRVYQGRAAFGRSATRPIVTQVLIAINVAVFVIGIAVGEGQFRLDFGLLGGAFLPNGEPIGVEAGEWYRIFTSAFLHAGLIHLGFNMLVLWMLGQMIEPAIGRLSFLALYVTSLIAGSLGVLILDPQALTVGASGAVFGLMGAAVVLQRASGINPWQSGIGTLVLINLVLTFLVPNISIGGHLGGLVGGAATGAVLVALRSRFRSPWVAIGACVAIDGVLLMASAAAAGQASI